MQRQRATVVALIVVAATAGCSTLLADPTPVPGAAATLTRSGRTPIPTPVRTLEPSPAAAAAPSSVSVGGSPGPSPSTTTSQGVSEDEIAQVQQEMEQAVASPDLPGIEGLLLDHISLSTPQGGSVLDASAAAAWLRDRAGAGIQVTRLERATQALMLQVFTDGWPDKDPIAQGQVNFSLRRYDANGRLDEENGDWKIDVIEVD